MYSYATQQEAQEALAVTRILMEEAKQGFFVVGDGQVGTPNVVLRPYALDQYNLRNPSKQIKMPKLYLDEFKYTTGFDWVSGSQVPSMQKNDDGTYRFISASV